MLLADPELVPAAASRIPAEHIRDPGIRELLDTLYGLQAGGEPPTLDLLRVRVQDPVLLTFALDCQDMGRAMPDRPIRFQQLLEEFHRTRHLEPKQQELKNRLQAASDHEMALELLRGLQNPN
jgi:hypothetical protein